MTPIELHAARLRALFQSPYSNGEQKLAAHDAVLEAAGYVIVPKEPTIAMLEAGAGEELSMDSAGSMFALQIRQKEYQLMLAAAPKVKP